MDDIGKRLVMMADYSADPLWHDRSGAMVPLERLPLSETTAAALREWRQAWESLALADEHDSSSEAALESEGRRLWMVVREELGELFEVGYAVELADADHIHVVWGPDAEPELPGWIER